MGYPSRFLAVLAAAVPLFALPFCASGDSASDRMDKNGSTVCTRIKTPEGYARVPVSSGSFEEFLRLQPLKPDGARVRYFDGREKDPDGVYCAVVDRAIRPGNIEQCADAIIRLRAEYLFAQKRYSDIGFNFLSDGLPRRYLDFAGGDRTYATFLKYLDFIFARANTTSLYLQLKPVEGLSGIMIGDVFIQNDRPINHAVILMDMAAHERTGEKIFLLAQSYMPAQETQILINPGDPDLSPWYSAHSGEVLETPEWRFYPAKDLRRF
jgi:hypothetical protein